MNDKNLLGYSNIFYRKPRNCIECKEREIYIEYYSEKLISKIRLRQINRTIDEFLIFLKAKFNHSVVKSITSEEIQEYIKYIKNKTDNGTKTKDMKIFTIKKWIIWMKNNNFINKDINI
jgi:site-specific recombinase XerD